MRGLWKAAALLAPALASADWMVNQVQDQDAASAIVTVPIPNLAESPDVSTILSFHVDVLASEHLCGYGNLTIDGQELVQEPFDFESRGEGSLTLGGKIVEGSWVFYCLNGFYGPYAQRLVFNILSVDGNVVSDVSFWVTFQQSGSHKILSALVLLDSSVEQVLPDSQLSAYEDDAEYDDFVDFENFDIEGEVAVLQWMKDLVQDFELQIHLREQTIEKYLSETDLEECDSLKCVIKTLLNKARATANTVVSKVYSKFADHIDPEDARPPWKRPHGKKPHHGKPGSPFPHRPKHGNHSHHNHTCPGRGNHSHPFPHHPPFGRRPPPFCRCPPRPPHHGPPHHRPPHSGPPHHGPPRHGPPRHGPPKGSHDPHQRPTDRKWNKVVTAIKFFVLVILLSLLVAVAYRRCCCSTARRQARRARREERRRRCAFRRAAHKHALRSWFARHICRSVAYDDLDEEEKRAMLAPRPINDQEDSIASEICEFRNAANVVSDIVAAEEGRVSMDSRASLPEYMSELGGEPLPTYEYGEGSELSSAVADGFRYTPGSSEYTPGHSEAGSVGDILGDIKE